MGPLQSIFVVLLLTIVAITDADRYQASSRVLTRNGPSYLGYASYGGGNDHTSRPLYTYPYPYQHGADYTGPLPDVGYALYRGYHQDFRNGGNKFCSSGFLISFLVGSITILRTFYNVAI